MTTATTFTGRHYETGSVHNALALQGVKAPHTGQPVSEALLMGISGGAAFGYFVFEYTGYPPHLVLLMRNTFDPLNTLFDRLALSREVYQTGKPGIAQENLVRALESGLAPLVWADMFTMPYNGLPHDDKMWFMAPLVVTAIENDAAVVADRSSKPFRVPLDVLTQARGRIKDDRYRVIALDAPDWDKLPSAVQKGIWQCVSLYVDAPPKGKRDNFGLAALQYWADMLVNTRNKMSWERYFPPGPRMAAALASAWWRTSVFDGITVNCSDGSAERRTYADFLDEAAQILSRPSLREAASVFRQAADAWDALAEAVLPDSIPALKNLHELKLKAHNLFIERGGEATSEYLDLLAQLEAATNDLSANFPMNEAQSREFRVGLREHVLKLHAIEQDAVTAIQSAMG